MFVDDIQFQYLALVRYCQTSYRSRKPLSKALTTTQQELNATRKRLADEGSKLVPLQQENKDLRALVQQAEDVEVLRAEVRRVQHLDEDVDQFNADLAAFRRLKADVRDLEVFRRHKTAILQHLKLLPKLIK